MPLPDAKEENGRSDTGVIWTGKVLEDREKNRGDFLPFGLLAAFTVWHVGTSRGAQRCGQRSGRSKRGPTSYLSYKPHISSSQRIAMHNVHYQNRQKGSTKVNRLVQSY